MSVVVVRVLKDKIEMACDSIMVKGWSKMPTASDKFGKMQKINETIVGGVGDAEELSLIFHFMKTHILDDVSESSIIDYFIEFKRWKNELCGNNIVSNAYIIASKGKAFYVHNMLVLPIDDYYAIGVGEDYANGALYMGASVIDAVKASCELCAMVCEPIKYEQIAR